jgi:hypothetical protein
VVNVRTLLRMDLTGTRIRKEPFLHPCRETPLIPSEYGHPGAPDGGSQKIILRR